MKAEKPTAERRAEHDYDKMMREEMIQNHEKALAASESKVQQEIQNKEYFMEQMGGCEKRIKELEQKVRFQHDLHLDYCRALKDRDKQLAEKEGIIKVLLDDLNRQIGYTRDAYQLGRKDCSEKV
jgi:hypothetical protein